MLGQRLDNVVDGDPTLTQHWLHVSCLPGSEYVHKIAVHQPIAMNYVQFSRFVLITFY